MRYPTGSRRRTGTQLLDETAGFTIIEIMIVLGIAGFIMLVVLLAIPTLVRNGRNDSRKQDVAAILEAVSHWELTNSGNFPITGTNPFLQYTQLHYYLPGSVNAQLGSGPPSNPNLDTVEVRNERVCDPASPGAATGLGAGYNDVVALYAIQAAGGSASSKCQQL